MLAYIAYMDPMGYIKSYPLLEANCNLDGKNRLGGARLSVRRSALEPWSLARFLARLKRLHHGFDSAELQLVPPDLRLRGCTEWILTRNVDMLFDLRQGWSSQMQSASLSSLRAFWEFLRQGYTYCNSYTNLKFVVLLRQWSVPAVGVSCECGGGLLELLPKTAPEIRGWSFWTLHRRLQACTTSKKSETQQNYEVSSFSSSKHMIIIVITIIIILIICVYIYISYVLFRMCFWTHKWDRMGLSENRVPQKSNCSSSLFPS